MSSNKSSDSPRVGQPVRGSQSGRPIMVALDLLGRRWSLRVIWELRGERVLTFRALQDACDGVSPTVLNRRLAELRDAGVVDHAGGYHLTERGRALMQALAPLHAWAEGALSEGTSSESAVSPDA